MWKCSKCKTENSQHLDECRSCKEVREFDRKSDLIIERRPRVKNYSLLDDERKEIKPSESINQESINKVFKDKLESCIRCEKKISPNAYQCPICGEPMRERSNMVLLQSNRVNVEPNKMASSIRVFSYIILVLGLIGSFTLGSTYRNLFGEYNWSLSLSCFFSLMITFFILAGIAEIISLLEGIRQK